MDVESKEKYTNISLPELREVLQSAFEKFALTPSMRNHRLHQLTQILFFLFFLFARISEIRGSFLRLSGGGATCFLAFYLIYGGEMSGYLLADFLRI